MGCTGVDRTVQSDCNSDCNRFLCPPPQPPDPRRGVPGPGDFVFLCVKLFLPHRSSQLRVSSVLPSPTLSKRHRVPTTPTLVTYPTSLIVQTTSLLSPSPSLSISELSLTTPGFDVGLTQDHLDHRKESHLLGKRDFHLKGPFPHSSFFPSRCHREVRFLSLILTGRTVFSRCLQKIKNRRLYD